MVRYFKVLVPIVLAGLALGNCITTTELEKTTQREEKSPLHLK
jgi:hypothetical protein